MSVEYPVRYIQRKKYYRVPQSQALTPDGKVAVYDANHDACSGCSLEGIRDHASCPQHRDPRLSCDQPMLCQDYECDESSAQSDGKFYDYTILKDYIFIPATKQGIADYVAHLLEVS